MEIVNEVSITEVSPSKLNPRKTFEKAGLKELQDSITAHGVLQPILVRKAAGGYEIICGERRYRAAVAAGLKRIPVKVVDMNDKQVLEVQVVENLQRADLHPLEEAEGYEKLMKLHGYAGVEQIAAKVSKSKSYVYGRLKLCELVPDCRKMFYDGKLTPSTALLIARIPKDQQKKAAKEITEEGYDGPLSLREARETIQRDYMLDLKGVAFAKDATICPERGECKTCQKRTSNQESLFDDIKEGDKCTDMTCFEAKRAEYIKRQTEKAKKLGFEIVKTEEVFKYGDRVENGFIDMKSPCYADNKSRSYGEILISRKDYKPLIAVDPNGVIREIQRSKYVAKALKEDGIGVNTPRKDPEAEKRKKEQAVREGVFTKVLPILIEKFKADAKQTFWPYFAEIILDQAGWDKRKALAKRFAPDSKNDDASEVVAQYLKKLPTVDIPAFCFEVLLTPSEYNVGDYSDALIGFAELYKVNLIALEKEVAAEQAKAKVKK